MGKRAIKIPKGFRTNLSDRSWYTSDGKRINRKGEITKLPQTSILKNEVVERMRDLRVYYPNLSFVPKYDEVKEISGEDCNIIFGYNLFVETVKPFTIEEREYAEVLKKEQDYFNKAVGLCRRDGLKLYPIKLTDEENNLRIAYKVLGMKDTDIYKAELAYGTIRRIYKDVFGDIDKALEINNLFRDWLHKLIRDFESSEMCKADEKTYKSFRESYDNTYLYAAPYDFNAFLLYMEINRDDKDKFYKPRYKQLRPIVQDLQDLYDGKLKVYGLSLPQGTGKTTLGLFFLAWVMGRKPNGSNFATSYSDTIAETLFNRVLTLINDEEYTYRDIFPHVFVAKESRMNKTIDFNKIHENPTLTCRTIGGSVVGVARYDNIGYADDMVSGYEESLNKTIMEKLWGTFVSQFLGRRKESGRVLLIGTRWSAYDPIGRMADEYKDNPLYKFVAIPALDFETDETNFLYDYDVGFSTEYYHNLRRTMDKDLWEVLYQQQSINKDGLVFPENELRFYGKLPENPDAILAVCDSKGSGTDYVALVIMYMFGNDIYVDDVVFDNGLPTITMPRVANKLVEHKVSRCDIESNSGGEFFALHVQNLVKEMNGDTSIVTFFTSSNKRIKIVTESDYIKHNFFFKTSDTQNSEYRLFMRNVMGYLANGKVDHDDAPDALAMGASLVKGLRSGETKIINRARLPF